MPRSPADKRTPLARLHLLIALAAVLGAAFVILQLRPPQVDARPEVDPITLSMLRLRLAQTPENADLRLELARTQLAAADYETTIETLKALESEQTPAGQKARGLKLEAQVAAWRSMSARDPRKNATSKRLVAQMEAQRALGPSPSVLQRHIEITLEMQRPDLAAALELNLAGSDDDASMRCPGAQGRACHALHAIDRALETGSGTLVAAVAADAVRLFPRHPSVVRRAAETALAANDVDDAIAWLETLLPYDPGRRTLDTLVTLELAKERPGKALALLQDRLRQDSSAIDLRPKIAQMAEWVGRPEVALEEWATIGRETADAGALDKARQLAQQLADIPLVCDLLLTKGRFQTLSTAELHDVEGSCDTSMLTEALAEELDRYVAANPAQLPALKLLALTLLRAGQLERSQGVQQTIHRLNPADTGALLKLAIVRWRLNDPAGALNLLVEHFTSTFERDVAYWRLRAELAWSLERDDESQRALDVLWGTGTVDATGAEQLLVLAEERRDYDSIIRVGSESWERFEHPDWLLTAMEAAVQGQRWERLRGLIEESREKSADFARSARWWMLVVELADHDRDSDAAMNGLRQAVALEPENQDLRETFLWRARELGDLALLEAAVRAWEADAEQVPTIWRPLATAFQKLGRASEAARWLSRAAATRVDDLEWQGDVAEEMENLGRRDLSLPVWRHVEALISHDTTAPALVRDRMRMRVAGLLHDVAKMEQAALQLLANHPDNQEVRADVIYALLDIGQPGRAREVLMSSPTPLPAELQVQVALGSQDRKGLAALLDNGTRFTTTERVSALRTLGHLTRARAVVRDRLPGAIEPERTELAEHAQQLREALGTRVSVTLVTERQHGLAVDSLEGAASTGYDSGRFSAAGTVSRVATIDSVYEANAAVAFEHDGERFYSRAAVGIDVRRDSILPQLGVQYRHRSRKWLEWGGELRLNSLTDLSPGLRAAGAQSRVGGVAQLTLTQDTLLTADAWAQRLSLRDNTALAHGFAGHAALEHTLRFSAVDLSFNLTGSIEMNRFTTDSANPNAPLDERGQMFAAARAFLVGGGVSVESPWALPRRFVPHWRLALWTGWLVPDRRQAFHAQLEAALPVNDDVTFVIDGFISNDQPWLSTSVGARLTVKVEK